MNATPLVALGRTVVDSLQRWFPLVPCLLFCHSSLSLRLGGLVACFDQYSATDVPIKCASSWPGGVFFRSFVSGLAAML